MDGYRHFEKLPYFFKVRCQNAKISIYANALDCKALPHPSTINDLEMSMNLRIIFSYVLIND